MSIADISKVIPDLGVGRSVGLTPNAPGVTPGKDFQQILTQGIESVNQDMLKADQMSQEFMTQGKHDLHEVIISLEKADLNFRFITQVRNKVLDAYNDIMRMQV